MTRTVKVAVIGSGLAGLTAAYRLAKAERLGDVRFEVHLFEKASSVGMDAHSVSVDVPGYEGEYRVDVPMRSFQGGYYPQLIALYKHLGVQFRQADFTYSFSTISPDAGDDDPKRPVRTTMIYNGQSGMKGVGMPTSLHPPATQGSCLPSRTAWARAYAGFIVSVVFVLVFYLRLVMLSLPLRPNTSATPINLRLRISIILQKLVTTLLPGRPSTDTTLREWTVLTTPRSPLARLLSLDIRWRAFVQNVIVPLFSAVCTCGEEMVWELPIEEVLDYVYLTFSTHHYVVSNGVRDVARRMSSSVPPSHIHLGMPIISLVYSITTVESEPMVDVHCVGGKVFTGFSHVIMATQANHAGRLLQSYLDTVPASLDNHTSVVNKMVQSLSKIQYCKSIVVNHTDATLMPTDERDRRDLNLITLAPQVGSTAKEMRDIPDVCVPPSYTMTTHVLPSPPSTPKSSPEDTLIRVYQTTNPVVPPRDDAILTVAKLERAVVTVRGKEAVRNFWRSTADAEEHEMLEEMENDYDRKELEEECVLRLGERDTSWGFRWGCSATERGVLGPLQGAGRLSRSLRAGRSTPRRTVSAHKEPGIWICGSYAHSGIPLLEGCVVSARNVVEQGIWIAEGLEKEGEKVKALW